MVCISATALSDMVWACPECWLIWTTMSSTRPEASASRLTFSAACSVARVTELMLALISSAAVATELERPEVSSASCFMFWEILTRSSEEVERVWTPLATSLNMPASWETMRLKAWAKTPISSF
jgi:hypothetical protein